MEAIIRCHVSDRTLMLDAKEQSWFVAVQGHLYLVGDGSDQSYPSGFPALTAYGRER
jgi:hypothetical protein